MHSMLLLALCWAAGGQSQLWAIQIGISIPGLPARQFSIAGGDWTLLQAHWRILPKDKTLGEI